MPGQKPHKAPTKQEILEAITSRVMALRLQPGDIIVTRDYNTYGNIEYDIKKPWPFPVPVICAPNGIEKCAVNELETALATAKEALKGKPKRK